MAAMTADLEEKGMLRRAPAGWELLKPLAKHCRASPDTLQQMLELQVDQLSELEWRVLLSATVAGQRFSAWAVATMLETGVADAEEFCEKFAQRQQFLRPGRAADVLGGALSAPYEFRHSLYREALLRRVPSAQRAQWHLMLAEKAEKLAASRPHDFASELALHFEQGRDPVRAARYLMLSAENASRRYGHRDALATLLHAHELLTSASSEATYALEIDLLERISDAQYALGQMVQTARTDGTAAALAADRGMWREQVSALTRAARALSFLDPEDCVAFCEMAARVTANVGDPLLEARTAMLAACWRIVSSGWTRADSDLCAATSAKIRDLLGPELPAYYEILYAHVQSLQAATRTCAIADAKIQRAKAIRN